MPDCIATAINTNLNHKTKSTILSQHYRSVKKNDNQRDKELIPGRGK